jgi:predicted transcriptional regulator
MHPPDNRGPAQVPGVPRAWLRALAIALTLPPTESRVILLILGMPKPVSAWWIAKHLQLKYSHTKRAVRSLVAWNILQKSANGLVFQPDHRVWQRPAA